MGSHAQSRLPGTLIWLLVEGIAVFYKTVFYKTAFYKTVFYAVFYKTTSSVKCQPCVWLDYRACQSLLRLETVLLLLLSSFGM